MRTGAEEFLRDQSKYYNICVCSTAKPNVGLFFLNHSPKFFVKVAKGLVFASGISKYIHKLIAMENPADCDHSIEKSATKLKYNPSRTILIEVFAI